MTDTCPHIPPALRLCYYHPARRDRCQFIKLLYFVTLAIPGGWTFVHIPAITALSTCDTGGRPPTPHYMDPASWPITCDYTNLTMCSREIIRPVFHPYG